MSWKSEHFTLAEMTVTSHGANMPTGAQMAALADTAARMDAVRAILGNRPIKVTSGYRSPQVNKAVGGAKTSAHLDGYAVDFKCPGYGTPAQIVKALRDSGVKFDQLIDEFDSWVHISFEPRMRQEVLYATKRGGRVAYVPGLRP